MLISKGWQRLIMGRSQLTTTDKINRLISNHFGNFRRSLMSLNERRAFDQLFAVAKNNRLAISQANDVLPVDAAQMAMLIDLQRQINSLQKCLDEKA